MELLLKPGDPCPDCRQLGQTKQLRYFYINVDEQILKCETETCLYPYNDEVSTDSELESGNESKSNEQNLDLQFSDGLLLLEELLNDSGPALDAEMKLNTEPAPSMPSSSTKIEIESSKNIEISLKEEKCKKTTNSNSKNNNTQPAQSKSKRAAPAKPESTTVNKKSKLQQIEKQQQSPPTATTTATTEIPKASISRYFAAINTQAQTNGKMPAKKRQSKSTKKTSNIELEVTKKVAMPNPLAEVLKLIKNKKPTT